MKGKRYKTPAGYRAPLRSREKIRAWLEACHSWDQRSYDYGRSGSLFCFNVKGHNIDFSFDHLLEIARKREIEEVEDPVYVEGCRERFGEVESYLWDWAIEDCQRTVIEDDFYRILWNDDETVAEWEFCGRSGGWLCLTAFRGIDLRDDWDLLDDISYRNLRDLYRFVVQCSHDFRREAVKDMIEGAAAWQFFVNECAACDTTEDRVAEWMADQSGEHDFAPVGMEAAS